MDFAGPFLSVDRLFGSMTVCRELAGLLPTRNSGNFT